VRYSCIQCPGRIFNRDDLEAHVKRHVSNASQPVSPPVRSSRSPKRYQDKAEASSDRRNRRRSGSRPRTVESTRGRTRPTQEGKESFRDRSSSGRQKSRSPVSSQSKSSRPRNYSDSRDRSYHRPSSEAFRASDSGRDSYRPRSARDAGREDRPPHSTGEYNWLNRKSGYEKSQA
jgi:hypothetical protein